MKKKTKVFFALLAMAICLLGLDKENIIPANAESLGLITVVDEDYTGKEIPALDTVFTGDYSTDTTERNVIAAVSPTPVPTVAQRTVGEDEGATTIVEEFVINGHTVIVETKYGENLEDLEVPENLNKSDPVTLYATDSAPVTRASYDPKTLVLQRQYSVDGDLAAAVTASYTVWYYTDGKVHLYSKTFDKALADGYGSSYYQYGSIVNTDGAVSYTSGDCFHLIGNGVNSTRAINFLVTSTYYDFYE